MQQLLGRRALTVAREAVASDVDKRRRLTSQTRVKLFLDDLESVVSSASYGIYAKERRDRLRPFMALTNCVSLFRRVCNDVARPVYSTPPLRQVCVGEVPDGGGADQEAWNTLETELRIDRKMALAARLTQACETVFLHVRHSERLGLLLDVITPNTVTVIPDPDDVTRELAIIYDRPYLNSRGETCIIHVYWDDFEAFQFADNGELIPLEDGSLRITEANGHPGVLPFVVVHKDERWGTYWDATSGQRLVAGVTSLGLLFAQMMRLHKTQGHKQIGITNTALSSMGQDMLLDEEAPFLMTDGTSASVLHDPTSATHFHESMDRITQMVAGEYGISLARLNQADPTAVDSLALLELRSEAIEVFADAEQRLFELLKIMSAYHPTARISPNAKLRTDFAEVSAKLDREKQLAIRKEERSMGLSSIVKNVLEDNPELGGDREAAWLQIEQNMADEALYVEKRRALNIPDGASPENPGQSAQANGALGPAVRDGQMTGDAAAQQAQTGAKETPKS